LAVAVPDFAGGANAWSLDAIDVTDSGAGRTLGQDGRGVYVAVFDSGLVYNWRAYFPEERIDSVRSFGGGGGERGTVSEQPNLWETTRTGTGPWSRASSWASRTPGPKRCPVPSTAPPRGRPSSP
jgi:hypothetical protein